MPEARSAPLPNPARSPSSEVSETINTSDPHHPTNKNPKIEAWLVRLPAQLEQFDDAFAMPVLTVAFYQDRLNWTEYRARDLLHELDKHEHQYRATGLKYHSIPHSVRHSQTHPTGVSISPTLLSRLAEIYETNSSVLYQPFFWNWFEVRNSVRLILAEVRSTHGQMDRDVLERSQERTEVYLQRAETAIEHVAAASQATGSLVETIRSRSSQATPFAVDLSLAFGLEGSLFRRWVLAFAEVQKLGLEVELVVEGLLKEGAKEREYWRTTANSTEPF